MSGIPAEPPAPPVVVPPAPPPTPPAPPNPVPVNLTSDQLAARLAESKSSGMTALLKELGFDKAEDAKTAIAKLKTLETSSLTEKEKLEQRIKELEPVAASSKSQGELLKSLIDEQFAALTPAQQATIDARAKGDPAQRYELMKFQRELAGAAPPAPPALPSPPANNPTPPAPPPNGALSKFQEWEQMKARAPMLGDLFYRNNQPEIERTRPST